jgi:hypothetical protein
MKPLEEAFSSTGFRRVILPGIVLAMGIHPLIVGFLPSIEKVYGLSSSILLAIEVIAFGLALSSGLQWIYYLFEGFRAPQLTSLAGKQNRAILQKLLRRRSEIQAEKPFEELSESAKAELYKVYERLQEYPQIRSADGVAQRVAERPTRLGNIIATYELYPESRYGVDAIDYWYHFLSLAPSDARKEFQESYAFAESLVLTSFSGLLIAILHILVLVGFAAGALRPDFVLITLAINPSKSLMIGIVGALVWWGFYQASLLAHKDAGAIFRSVVDLSMPAFLDWTQKMKDPVLYIDDPWRTHLGSWLKDLKRPEC